MLIDTFKRLLASAIVVIMAVGALAYTSCRLGLVYVHPDFFALTACVVVALCSVWLHNHDHKTLSKVFLLAVLIGVPTIWVKHMAPGMFHLGTASGQNADLQADRSAELAETPHAIPCSAPFFVTEKGKPRYWYAPSEHPVICYDRSGVQPETREKLVLIDGGVVTVIKREHDEADRKAREAAAAQAKAQELALLEARTKAAQAEAEAVKARQEAEKKSAPPSQTKSDDGWGPATSQQSSRNRGYP